MTRFPMFQLLHGLWDFSHYIEWKPHIRTPYMHTNATFNNISLASYVHDVWDMLDEFPSCVFTCVSSAM